MAGTFGKECLLLSADWVSRCRLPKNGPQKNSGCHLEIGYCYLTEVWRTRSEWIVSGVVRGPAESSVPGWRLS